VALLSDVSFVQEVKAAIGKNDPLTIGFPGSCLVSDTGPAVLLSLKVFNTWWCHG
jgi:hypothetical protein